MNTELEQSARVELTKYLKFPGFPWGSPLHVAYMTRQGACRVVNVPVDPNTVCMI